ncbi:MAG: DUF6600 domain-containing protein [Acidobacteriota bacterium]
MRHGRALSTLMGIALLPSLPLAAQPVEEPRDPLPVEVVDRDGSVYSRAGYLEGQVDLLREDVLRSDLSVNDPLVPGDRLTTGPDGLVEIESADGSLLRLAPNSELGLLSLADSANQVENATLLQLVSGSLLVRPGDLGSHEGRFQIDTPAGSIFLLSDGSFRIDTRPDGAVVVSSRGGAAEVMAQEVSTIVRSGERVMVHPGRIPPEPQAFNTLLQDDFDRWAAQRDESMVRRHARVSRTPPGLPGPVEPYADELARYGQWIPTTSYGWVWRPVGMAPDWQPYLYGHWAYVPAGLVWVAAEPWGWAPFHYGRWEFLMGRGWVWVPGYVFSGAHVAWSYSPGYFGWCALGYYDTPVHIGINFGFGHSPWVYIHGGRIYDRHIERVVIHDVTIIHEVERNRVVLRGTPRIRPERVARTPRIADDLFRRAVRQHALRPATGQASRRRMPFRENEKQQLVRRNNRRISPGGNRRVHGVNRRVTGRPILHATPVRHVPVSRTRSRVIARPGQRPPRSHAPPRSRQQTSEQRWDHEQVSPRRPAPPRARPQRDPRFRPGDSVPERVLPRIVPKRRPRRPFQRELDTKPPARPSSPRAGERVPGQAPSRSGRPGPQVRGKPRAGDHRPGGRQAVRPRPSHPRNEAKASARAEGKAHPSKGKKKPAPPKKKRAPEKHPD